MNSNNENYENKSKLDPRIIKIEREKTYKEMQREMFEEVYSYSVEMRDKQFANKYPKLANFKKNLYPALDNLLKQCDLIKDEKLKLNKMKIIYVWFSQKKKSYFNLSNVDRMSTKQDYEKIQDPIDIKYTQYEAGNTKEEFEKERRTDIANIDPAKVRIKNYKAKSILPFIKGSKDNEKNNKIKLNKNTNEIKTINSPSNNTNGLTSSYDTSAFKNAKFNKTARTMVTTKSYDKLRSKKNSESKLDMDTLKAKNREIAEKRSMSEMKMYMDDWALVRSKLNEELQRKTEMKFYLKNYEINPIKEEKANYENNTKSNDVEYNIANLVEKVFTKKVRNVVNNKIRKSKNMVKKIKILSKSNRNSPDKKSKIYQENLLNLEAIPSDIFSDMNSNIKSLQVRHLYGDAIDVDTISNKKDGYLLYVKPLSMLDHSICLKNDNFIDKAKRSMSLDFKEINPEKYNMLSQRKTLAAFNFNEVNRLKGELSKENINIPMHTLRRAFISPETLVYPKHYLPNSGFGLLSNPFVENKKKKAKL